MTKQTKRTLAEQNASLCLMYGHDAETITDGIHIFCERCGAILDKQQPDERKDD